MASIKFPIDDTTGKIFIKAGTNGLQQSIADGIYTYISENNFDDDAKNKLASIPIVFAPTDAQKNSDITIAEIENKLIGEISTHSHAGTGDMLKSVYDTNDDGIIDKAIELNDGVDSYTIANIQNIEIALTDKVDEADILTKTNLTPFTPSADYNPATKKYVDDNARSTIYDNGAKSGSVSLNFSNGDYQQLSTVASTPITAITMINSVSGDAMVIEIDNANGTVVTAKTTQLITTTDVNKYKIILQNINNIIMVDLIKIEIE